MRSQLNSSFTVSLNLLSIWYASLEWKIEEMIIINRFTRHLHLSKHSIEYQHKLGLKSSSLTDIEVVLEIVFESVQQNNLDKTIFDQHILSRKPTFMAYEILGHDCSWLIINLNVRQTAKLSIKWPSAGHYFKHC